jgi:hypothetical protein
MDVGLVTSSLATCSAIAIADPKDKRQFLGHVDIFTKVTDISAAVQKEFPHLSKDATVFIVKGSMESNTEKNIYLAMKQLGYENQVKFVDLPPSQGTKAIAVRQGNLFTYDLGMSGGAFSSAMFGGSSK